MISIGVTPYPRLQEQHKAAGAEEEYLLRHLAILPLVRYPPIFFPQTLRLPHR
jgi:hypothetical protein